MASTSTSRRALLVCDVQLGILPIALGTDEEATTAYVGRCNTAIAHARSKGDKVIFIRVGFEPGHPEVGPKNKVRPLFTMRERDIRVLGLAVPAEGNSLTYAFLSSSLPASSRPSPKSRPTTAWSSELMLPSSTPRLTSKLTTPF